MVTSIQRREGSWEATARQFTIKRWHDETDDEAAPALLAPEVPGITAMSASDLAHEGQPQSCPGARSTESVERPENALALRLRDARPMVADTEFRAAIGVANAHFNGRGTVAPGVVQEVPDHPAEQARVSAHAHRLPPELDLFVARAFLTREGE